MLLQILHLINLIITIIINRSSRHFCVSRIIKECKSLRLSAMIDDIQQGCFSFLFLAIKSQNGYWLGVTKWVQFGQTKEEIVHKLYWLKKH